MKNRKLARISLFALLVAMLSGCMGKLQSETIIIPDTETESASAPVNAPFEVKKIYRLPLVGVEDSGGYVWVGPNSLVVSIWDNGLKQLLGSIDYPYDNLEKISSPDSNISIEGFSPDGRYMAGFARSDSGYQLKLFSVSDGQGQVIDTLSTSNLASKKLAWSDNSRFVSYLTWGNDNLELSITVYDVEKSSDMHYTVPYGKEKINLSSAFISDDGNSALIVKETYEGWSFQLGRWNGSEFDNEYEHSISAENQVSWINNDQIAFVGTDGTLFLYDMRNELISVLKEQVIGFRLSADRQYMAFSTNEDKIYVSKLQGNNLLNEKMVFQGVVSSRMSWSPDNGMLLVQGSKPYMRSSVVAPVANLNSPFIIEFQ